MPNRFFIQMSLLKKSIVLISLMLCLSACAANQQTIEEELTPLKGQMATLETSQQELFYRLDALEQRILSLHSETIPTASSKIVQIQTASPIETSSTTVTPVPPKTPIAIAPVPPKASTTIVSAPLRTPVEIALASQTIPTKPTLNPSPDEEIVAGKYRLIDPSKAKGTIAPASMEKQKTAVAPTPIQKPQSIVTKPQNTLEQEYARALQAYQRRDYKTSLSLFDAITKNYPNSPLAINAHYWMGECLYALQQNVDAIFTFKHVASTYPKHSKAPDALLKTALSYRRLGDAQNTAAHIRILFEDYLTSPAAQRAKQLGL